MMSAKKPRLTRKQAERQLSEARSAVEWYDDQTQRETNAALVGRFFKYRNSYSCPSVPEDYWWLYLAVTEMNEHGTLHGWSFQTDKDGRMEIEPHARVLGQLVSGLGSNYIEIERKEFYAAFDQLAQTIRGRIARDLLAR